MLSITLSHFSLEGRRVHQVLVNGAPVIAETEDADFARRKAEEVASGTGMFRGQGARWTMQEWDGDTCELTELGSGRVAA